MSKSPPLPFSVSFCTLHLSGRVPSMPGGFCRPQLRQRTGERDVSPWESPLTASDDGWPDYGVLFTHTQFTSHWAAGSGRAVEHIRVFQAGHGRSHACMCAHTRLHESARVHKIRRGVEITKEKGANSSLQPCHVRSIWQINPLLRRRWLLPLHSEADLCRFATHDDMSNQISSSVCSCGGGFIQVCLHCRVEYHCICKLDLCYRLEPPHCPCLST